MGRMLVWLLSAVLALGAAAPVVAEDFTIGYLQLSKDSRYAKKRTYARLLLEPLGRPYSGARVAIDEVKFHGAAVGATFKVKRHKGKGALGLLEGVDKLSAEGVRFFVVDAPADVLSELAGATKGRDLLLFNITAREDRLRQDQCQEHLLHVIPSFAMLTDALVQYLITRKWREILVLEGTSDDDKKFAEAFARSARLYGAEIVETRPFVLSNDPRQRDQNNITLLTTGVDYDVVFVADTDGEFARDVPYQTARPRPVVGSEGLGAAAWHWAWERHGAPQLENRFQDRAKRPMRDIDWAAWMAVKAVAEAVQRTESKDFAVLRDYLRGPDLVLDGFKGNRLNFRPWNNQLRQPILLVTHNWVVERAPLKGFLHQTNNLDTLGFNENDSGCRV